MPLSVEKIIRKAKRHAKKGERDLAAQQYKIILEKYPQNLSAISGIKELQNVEAPQEQIDQLITLFNHGRLEQALDFGGALEKQYPNMLVIANLLGAVNIAMERFEQAAVNFTRALQIDSSNAEIHNNLGITLYNLGRIDKAVASFVRALELKPGYGDAHNNLGNSLKDLGKLDEVISNYEKALKNRPDFAEAHNNLGIALLELGNTEEAAAAYTRALEIKPDYAEAHNNLGVVLKDLGRTDEAINSYAKALQVDGNNATAHSNLGVALIELGNLSEAFAHFQKSICLAPDRKNTWQNFSGLLLTLSFEKYNQQWADIYLALLDQKTVARPSQLARPILSLLKQHPAMSNALQMLNSGDIQNTAMEVCASLSDIPLLLRTIELSPIFDLDTEKLLRALRHALLTNCEEVVDSQAILRFQSSLALHCFTNEYVWSETAEELLLIRKLETNIEKRLSDKTQPSSYQVACLGSYRALHKYGWSKQLLVLKNLEDLFERQIKQVLEEVVIGTKVRMFGDSNDQVSKAVRAQYEENPYPRWINTALYPKPAAILEVANTLKLKLNANAGSFSDHPNVLIAGCGTGQQAIGTATRFLDSKVLAIDLSISSISYAIRKTYELGISNIEYIQADILDIESMDKQFDVIESTGVLHHMAYPLAGWKILTDRLKAGGLMKIGLYSELARKPIIEAREIISEMGLPQTKEAILKFRAEVLVSKEERFAKLFNVTKIDDFFSTSELRDLLFHVQEHRFTLPQIKAILDVLDLSFVGFEFWDNKVIKKFKKVNPDPRSLYCLDVWHQFELENVDIFSEMYQLWVQKNINR